jgi:hypothetical protein
VKIKATALCEKDRKKMRALLPIIALGGSLAAPPVAALELGELTVQSNLGRPLRASIAYALAPNEVLSNTCVSIHNSTSGLPGIGAFTISVTERAIIIAGKASIREPMLGMRVTVNCPQTPNLSRDYMLFVDPENTTQVNDSISAVMQTRNVSETARKTPTEIRQDLMEPIGQSSRYQAKVGDTLSNIVSRIENRSMKLWPAVDAIFEANPHAFIGNDPNKLKAGSWLEIPSLDGTAPVVAEAATVADTLTQDTPAATSTAANTAEKDTIAVYEPSVAVEVPAAIEAPQTFVEQAAAEEIINELRSGDIVLDGDSAMLEPAGAIAIPDTELAGPKTTSASPNVPTAIITTDSARESTSPIKWLIGGSVALVAGLLLFLLGRRARSHFGSAPVDAVIRSSAVPDPADIEKLVAENELDYDISDDSPTEENLALDVDLAIGTGLGEGTDVEVIEQFGFAETAKLDIELPGESQAEKNSETDIIAPIRLETGSILESEVLPEEDDYDMSVIMDATKMPHHEDVTERDLMAVEVGTTDEIQISGNYTISKEVDYNILEQDYENELTATQALNEEIERAAAALVEDLNQAVNDGDEIEMDIEGGTVNMRAS